MTEESKLDQFHSSMRRELEDYFIYELQHIPRISVIPYFTDAELNREIDAAYLSWEELMEDFPNMKIAILDGGRYFILVEAVVRLLRCLIEDARSKPEMMSKKLGNDWQKIVIDIAAMTFFFIEERDHWLRDMGSATQRNETFNHLVKTYA